jgi:hypothetical protein
MYVLLLHVVDGPQQSIGLLQDCPQFVHPPNTLENSSGLSVNYQYYATLPTVSDTGWKIAPVLW